MEDIVPVSEQSEKLRTPPNSSEAELAVVSSMLFDKDAVTIAYELLRTDDFYRPDYKAIFDAITELFTTSKPIDLVTLKAKLEEHGNYDKIGGRDTLAVIASNISTSANIRHYCKIVSDKAVLRRLVKASQDIYSLSYDAKNSVDSVLEQAEQSIFNISKNRHSAPFVKLGDALLSAYEQTEKAALSGGGITGVSTGFIDFDNKTTGLHASELILIAARPSMGKSALGINIAHHAAVRNNVTTAFFTLEMSKEQVVDRIISAEAKIESQKLRTGKLEPAEWAAYAASFTDLSPAPLYIDDTAGISVSELRAKCRRLKLEKNLGLIVIDYLQLMSGSSRTRSENRQQEISEISRSLKAISRDIEAPVIALAQLSRACETREDKRPRLSDLRESGAIEQDADIVSFIYRDEYYNKDSEQKGVAEWIIAKQRNGATGTVELVYDGRYTSFRTAERRQL
ncbi:MAG: replicative DNA helicase [Clostridiales bacterium]|jgi:replicative DNA helicase|nr:replicative DNA helicase [Clostridiales bacterium]